MSSSIALVDDDQNILTSVSMALEAEGYDVTTYSDGAEAACPFASSAIASPSRKHSSSLGSRRRNRSVPAWIAQA